MSIPVKAGDRAVPAPLLAKVQDALAQQLAAQLAAGLYIVATPIGNLADISLRALATLAQCDIIYCEDTRHSRTLLAHYGITRPLRAYHDHSDEAARADILAELAAGRTVGLISDAGTPLVSDPGYKLVRGAIAAGRRVTIVPGASASLAALAIAGLPTDTVLFAGFLPSKDGARRARLDALKSIPATLLLFEAPSRLAGSLAAIAAVLDEREAVVARELTKVFEEVRRGTPAELAAWARAASPRGEMVILVAPPPPAANIDDAEISARLSTLLDELSLKDAAKAVAAELGVAKGRVYDLGLALKRQAGRS